MQTQFDALIVGAGPAGSTAAILLARAGWSVALVERHEFPRRKVCGECIAASNLGLLDALGVGDAIAAGAGPDLRQVALMHGPSSIVADLPPFDHSRHAWGRALGRETLDTLLLARARATGAVVLQPWSARMLEGVAGDYRCAVRAIGTEEVALLRAPVAIDAHGSWEPLPATRALRRGDRRPSSLFAFKANFEGTQLAKGLLPVLSFEGGYGGMVFADGGTTTLACCIRRDRLGVLRRASPGVAAGDVVGAMLRRECSGVDAALRTARRVGPWISSGPIQPGIHLRGDDEVLRIGNAAGEAHPIIGEGISMAMQSAWLLCAHLLRAGSRQLPHHRSWQLAVCERYAADWRRHFTRRIRVAAVLAHLAMHPRWIAPFIPSLNRSTSLFARVARWSGKVSCAPDPPIIVEGKYST